MVKVTYSDPNRFHLVLGHAQDIYLCEFDGPQTRTVNVTVMGE